MKKYIRSHDSIYLKENRYDNYKESFLFLVKLLNKVINKERNYSLIDVGCANGELIYLLKKRFKNISFTGLDIRKDLIRKAKKKLGKKVNFINNDIFKNTINEQFDFVICSGVIGITDEPKKFLNNLKKIKKKKWIHIFISSF